MNCRGDEDIDAKRSRPSIGKPVMGHARKERVVLFGTDQRITSGPAAKRPHSKAEYMTAPERFADSQIPLAPRAPSIHDPSATLARSKPRSAAVLDGANSILSTPGGVVRLGVMQREYHWHKHDNDDEFFLPSPLLAARRHVGARPARASACWISRSTSSAQDTPLASNASGYMLMLVKPGIVFTSFTTTLMSGRRKKSTRAMPSQPSARNARTESPCTRLTNASGRSAGTFSSAPCWSRYFAS